MFPDVAEDLGFEAVCLAPSALMRASTSVVSNAMSNPACMVIGGRMSLLELGRARLAMVLPHHREQLRSAMDDYSRELFEAYALASTTLDNLEREMSRREDLIHEYHQICLDLQAEVLTMLTQKKDNT